MEPASFVVERDAVAFADGKPDGCGAALSHGGLRGRLDSERRAFSGSLAAGAAAVWRSGAGQRGVPRGKRRESCGISDPGFALWHRQHAAYAGLHGDHRTHTGARNRRHDGDLQRGEPHLVRTAAVPARQPDHDDLGFRDRRLAQPYCVPYVSRTGGAEPFLRRDRRDEGMAADTGQCEGTRTIRWAVRERWLLPSARCAAVSGKRL